MCPYLARLRRRRRFQETWIFREIDATAQDVVDMLATLHWKGWAFLGFGFGVVLRGLVHYGAADIRRPGLYERFSTENRIKKE